MKSQSTSKSGQAKVVSIVLTWNSADFIEECLHSLEVSTYKTDILVIDNDSADNTRELIACKFPKIKVINSGANLGYAGGNNLGITIARKKDPAYVFIINPDANVAPDCIEQLVTRLDEEQDVAAASPLIYKHNSTNVWFGGSKIKWRTGETIQFGGNDKGQFNNSRYTERVNGCAMLVSMSAIKDVGMMDDRFFLYYEESDWSVSFAEHGYKNGFVPHAHVWHKVSSSAGQASKLYYYYMSRNRLLFVKKHKPWFLPIVLLSSLYLYPLGLVVTAKRSGLTKAVISIRPILKGHRDFFLHKLGRQAVS